MTNEARTYVAMNPATNATPAGGQEEPSDFCCDHTPHVYVVYWPDHGILKIGISETARWEWWYRRGAVLIAAMNTCCTEHARTIEHWMLGRVRRYGAQAFGNEEEARFALGKKKGGYTECIRMVQSPRFTGIPDHFKDYESAYGLIMPPELIEDLHAYDFVMRPAKRWDRGVA